MLIKGIVLEVLFQLTLFALLVIVVYKLIKQYLIPFLYQEIRRIKKYKKDLSNKNKLLNASKKRLENQIKQQDDSFVLLEQKVHAWYKSVVDSNEKKQEENKKILEHVEKKRKAQLANLSLRKIQKIVIPEAIEQAYQEIEKKYEGDKGLQLLQELIEKVQPEGK
jgi:biopolymer transport protein ExbB/TolQ